MRSVCQKPCHRGNRKHAATHHSKSPHHGRKSQPIVHISSQASHTSFSNRTTYRKTHKLNVNNPARPFSQHTTSSLAADDSTPELPAGAILDEGDYYSPQGPAPRRIGANPDGSFKVYGNNIDEDPSEAVVRSILPNGIVRVTGIENPRLGSFIGIRLFSHIGSSALSPSIQSYDLHANGGTHRRPSNLKKPTITPQNNVVFGEVIRVTAHETFIALPCAPDTVSAEDIVFKVAHHVPGFRVPRSFDLPQYQRIIGRFVPDITTQPLPAHNLVALTGTVLNAMGELLDVHDASYSNISKTLTHAQKRDLSSEIMHSLSYKMPYNNTLARSVLHDKLASFSSSNGDEIDNNNDIKKHPYQQLYQTFNGDPSYNIDIDDDLSEDESSYPFFSPLIHKSSAAGTTTATTTTTTPEIQYYSRPSVPSFYRGQPTHQIITGLTQIDMLNPLRLGSRVLFTSTDQESLSKFGATVLKNVLQQRIQSHPYHVLNPQVHRGMMDLGHYPEIQHGGATTDDNNANNNSSLTDNKEHSQRQITPPDLSPKYSLGQQMIGIYCLLGRTNAQRDELLTSLGSDVVNQSIFIHTNEADTAYAHQMAVKQAIALSDILRLQGKHCLVILDNLALHSESVLKLHEPFHIAQGIGLSSSYHIVNSIHAELLDNIGSIQIPPHLRHLRLLESLQHPETPEELRPRLSDDPTIGTSTAICLFTEHPKSAIPSLAQRQNEQILDNLKSIVDRTIPFNDHLQGQGYWPPIAVQSLHHSLPFANPTNRPLLQLLNQRLLHCQHLDEYSQISTGLGIPLDFDIEQVLIWRPKIQAMLMQNTRQIYSLTQQYGLLFNAAQEHLLCGVELADIPTYKRFLLHRFQQTPLLMSILQDVLNISSLLPAKGVSSSNRLHQSDHDELASDAAAPAVTTPAVGILVNTASVNDHPGIVSASALPGHDISLFQDKITFASNSTDVFMTEHFSRQINVKGLTEWNSPLFRAYQSINTTPPLLSNPASTKDSETTASTSFEDEPARLQQLVKQVQHKYSVGQPYQNAQQKQAWDKLFYPDAIGEHGLPAILDEILQALCNDLHEQFLAGRWHDIAAPDIFQTTSASSTTTAGSTSSSLGSSNVFISHSQGAQAPTLYTTPTGENALSMPNGQSVVFASLGRGMRPEGYD